MTRFFFKTVLAVSLLSLLLGSTAWGQQKPGKSWASEEAAKWVAKAGDHFGLVLYGAGDKAIVLTTDRKRGEGQTNGVYFVITRKEAAAIVQVLVDCGLWDRPDTLPELPVGRLMTVGSGEGRDLDQRTWRLGFTKDDLSSLFIMRHLLDTSTGERKQALKSWLAYRPKTPR